MDQLKCFWDMIKALNHNARYHFFVDYEILSTEKSGLGQLKFGYVHGIIIY